MATRAENLEAALNGYGAKLAEIATGTVTINGVTYEAHKLTYSENGRSMDWLGYQSFLIEKMKELQVLLALAESGDAWEVRTRGVP